MKWLLLLGGISCNAAASVLIKIAMNPPFKSPSLSEPLMLLGNWPLWLGLSLYGGAFVIYAATLTQLPLNVAHPVLTAGAIAAVALSSGLIFHEPFPWTTLLGIALVVLGVILITLRVS